MRRYTGFFGVSQWLPGTDSQAPSALNQNATVLCARAKQGGEQERPQLLNNNRAFFTSSRSSCSGHQNLLLFTMAILLGNKLIWQLFLFIAKKKKSIIPCSKLWFCFPLQIDGHDSGTESDDGDLDAENIYHETDMEYSEY